MLIMTLNEIERFTSKIYESGSDWPDECDIWMGSSDKKKGYGFFSFRGAVVKVHRLQWIINYGNIPNGLFVLHRCDNPSCVKLGHLFLGTNQDNMTDMKEKGRHNNGKSKVLIHGTLSGYTYWKCRCDLCSEQNSKYQKNYYRGIIEC